MSRAYGCLDDMLKLYMYLICVLSNPLSINEFNVLCTSNAWGIIFRDLRQPSSPLRFTNNDGRTTSFMERTTLPLSKMDVGTPPFLVMRPNVMDLYIVLLPFNLGWNLNSFSKAITSFFLKINLIILRFIFLFKIEKEKEAYGEKYLEWNFLFIKSEN